MITSGGNRNPANADRSTCGRAARGRRTRPASSASPDRHRRARRMQQPRTSSATTTPPSSSPPASTCVRWRAASATAEAAPPPCASTPPGSPKPTAEPPAPSPRVSHVARPRRSNSSRGSTTASGDRPAPPTPPSQAYTGCREWRSACSRGAVRPWFVPRSAPRSQRRPMLADAYVSASVRTPSVGVDSDRLMPRSPIMRRSGLPKVTAPVSPVSPICAGARPRSCRTLARDLCWRPGGSRAELAQP